MKCLRLLSLLLLLPATLSTTAAADDKTRESSSSFDAQREKLNESYLEKLAGLRRQYEADFMALQQAETAGLKAKQATAMKALNLEQANHLNADIQRVQSATAAAQLRTLFVRRTSRGEKAYFIRCPDGEWIERIISRRANTAHSYRVTAETHEYIELTHQSGSPQHRLYEDRDMVLDDRKGKGDFTMAGRGSWEYADAAARAAAEQPDGTELPQSPEQSAADAFTKSLTSVIWKGVRPGWPDDFRFTDNGQVITSSGQVMPQKWVLVKPGHIITVNDRIIDSLTVDLDSGTLRSYAFSEDTPKASWTTKQLTTVP
jgi:hypothetical protein